MEEHPEMVHCHQSCSFDSTHPMLFFFLAYKPNLFASIKVKQLRFDGKNHYVDAPQIREKSVKAQQHSDEEGCC